MPKRPDGIIRAFGISGLQIVNDLQQIENAHAIDLDVVKKSVKGKKVSEYEQFESDLRQEAARVSEFYEVFYWTCRGFAPLL